MILESIDHAKECAQYIYDNDINHIDYGDHCTEGKDPRMHILWSAASVLDLIESEGFKEEYQQWDDKQSAKKRIRGTW
jgi:hypothetical protein